MITVIGLMLFFVFLTMTCKGVAKLQNKLIRTYSSYGETPKMALL